jgi:16S rRNA G966 N2-methylase RsmD
MKRANLDTSSPQMTTAAQLAALHNTDGSAFLDLLAGAGVMGSVSNNASGVFVLLICYNKYMKTLITNLLTKSKSAIAAFLIFWHKYNSCSYSDYENELAERKTKANKGLEDSVALNKYGFYD